MFTVVKRYWSSLTRNWRVRLRPLSHAVDAADIMSEHASRAEKAAMER